jgi:hypothetical protein
MATKKTTKKKANADKVDVFLQIKGDLAEWTKAEAERLSFAKLQPFILQVLREKREAQAATT